MKQSFVDYVAKHTKGGRDRLLYPGKEASSRAERRKTKRQRRRSRQGVSLPCEELPCDVML